ncbi:TPA: hypothetical protein ACH3X1_008631 [Trebouxia sp. C0004]
MGLVAAVVFCITLLLQLVVVTLCTLWPIKHDLVMLTRPHGWQQLYSIANSNLDVWVLSTLACLANISCLASVASYKHKPETSQGAPPYKITQIVIAVLALLTQLLLLGKAVMVALLADEIVLPGEQAGQCGLLAIYLAVCSSIIGLAVQYYAAESMVSDWQESFRAESPEVLAPLLDKTDASNAASSSEGTIKSKSASRKHETETVKALLSMSAVDTPLLMLAFAAGAAAALGQALVPYFTGKIIDYASIEPDRQMFQQTTLKLVGVAFGCAVFTGVRGGLFTLGMARLNLRIRTRLFHSLLRQDIGFFDTTKTGEITSRLAADTTTVSDQVCLNLNVALRSVTQAAMVLVFMFAASWRLTVVTFIIIPVILAICKLYGQYYRMLAKQVQTELAQANGVADEVLATMTTVRAHAADDSAKAAYAVKLAKFYVLQRKEAVAYGAYACTNTFLPTAVAAVVLFYGGNLVLEGHMSAGALVSFMLYQQSLHSAFQMLGDVFSALTAAVGAADKVVELMQQQPGVPPHGALQPADFAGRVELDSVAFSYPARPEVPVLNGLSLKVNPGEVVALVGPSGGGKSSIVKLVERFYLPSAGAVRMDGRDVGVYDEKWLRRRVAIVSQEPTLYARSIRRNICYGLELEDGVAAEEVPTSSEIEEAARLANAHDFIMDLPQGYDTDCGDKGVALSGGQKQRIAIARALVRKPTVLLLDEATSALDADSEAVVQEALDRMMRNHTVLVIAHRLSTIQNADRILVINKGVVVEDGSHDQLLEAGGVYSTLVRRQMQKNISSASLGSLGHNESSSSLRDLIPRR